MPNRLLRKKPYISKNPEFDSFRCDCGAVLRRGPPCTIEAHFKTPTHKKILETLQDEGQTIPGKE